MRSHPLFLLPFDQVGAEQLEWDRSSEEITYATPLAQSFRCQHDALYRIEIFIEPTFHFKRSHLWLEVATVTPGEVPRPLRVAGPLATEQLVAHGWFAFEFEPIPESAGRTYSFSLYAPDATPGNALAVRMSGARRLGGRSVAGQPQEGALTYRASCVRAPRLRENFVRSREHSAHRTETVNYQPLMARLEISRPCNLHCIMCQRGLHPFDAKREAPGFMSPATVRTLDPILPTVLRVLAFGLGEPFLNPHYLEILRHLRQHARDASIFTSTNGTRLSDETIAALVDENLLSDLQISLDGNEREAFESIRKQASFDTVVGAFERVAAARARRGTRSLRLTGAMLIMKPNFTQVTGFAKRMLALGIDRISFDSPKDATFQPLRADSDPEMERIMEQMGVVAEMLEGTGTELIGPMLSELVVWHQRSGRSGRLPRWGADECAQLKSSAEARRAACAVPWETVSLLADGNLHVCCNSYRRLGHVQQASIGEMWRHGPGYGGLRQELLQRKLHTDCRSCLGQNFVMPGEVTPITYLEGTLVDTGATTRALQLGTRVENALAAVAGLRAGLDATDWHSTGRVRGWVALPDTTPRPIMLALALGGVLRAFTAAIEVAPTLAQWSAVLELEATECFDDSLEPFLVEGPALRRIEWEREPAMARLGISDEPTAHGFIDEVKCTGRSLHFIGWARHGATGLPIDRVVLMLAGKPVCSTRPWLPRPDVARAYGGERVNFGYALELPRALTFGLPANALVVGAMDSTGRVSPLEWSPAAAAVVESFTAPIKVPTPAPMTAPRAPLPRVPVSQRLLGSLRRRFRTTPVAAGHLASADRGY